MATNNVRKIAHSPLLCDICESQNIAETQEGYVCRDCGVVLEEQKLEYHRPYDDKALQYAPLSKTQIGTPRERIQSPESSKLNRWKKIDSIKDNEKLVLEQARREIKTIFSNAGYPDSYRALVLKRFKGIWLNLRPNTKFRGVKKLVPIVVFHTLKMNNYGSITKQSLLENSDLTEKEFNAFFTQYGQYLSDYKKRNRIDTILNRVFEIMEHFDLGMPFFYQSKKILLKFWNGVKNTKDDVIAGLMSAISILCSVDLQEKVTISGICTKLGIKMSTIQFQVKNRIFKRLKVDGFVSLKKSADLLRKILMKMGILDKIMKTLEEDRAQIVEVQLGNAEPIFNWNNNLDYYFFVFQELSKKPVYLSIRSHSAQEDFDEKKEEVPQPEMGNKYDVRLWKYSSIKDPPQTIEP